MIFAATHRLVTRGAKTATRRPMVPYPTELPARPAPGIGHHPAPPAWPKKVRAFDQDWKALSYKPGDVRAVQPGRGQLAVGHITIQTISYERLGDITDHAAVAEGFKDRDQFIRAWVGLHDKAWARFTDELLDHLPARSEQLGRLARDLKVGPRTLERRLRYLLSAGAAHIDAHTGEWDRCEHGEHEARRYRFEDRHAHRPVWVVTFDLVTDPALLLAARPPRAIAKEHDLKDLELASSPENRGYTLSPYQAVPDEPEVIDDLTAKRFEKDARGAETIRAAWDRQRELDELNALIARVEARATDTDRAYLQKLLAARRQLQRAA